MNNRLTQKIKTVKRKKLFCAYLTLGFPNLSTTEKAILALEEAGADVIELGIPFSDPLADGPTIQFASSEAIRRGVHLKDAFRLIQSLRRKGLQAAVLFFSYVNPILNRGVSRVAKELKQSGFDGLIIPDLPPEEGKAWEKEFKKNHLSLVYLIAPTTRARRAREIAARSSDFIYYVSLRGVTGARRKLPADLIKKLRSLKKMTKKPVLVGFGVSKPEQAQAIAKVADGIIVGSAIVQYLKKGEKAIPALRSYVSRLIRAMKK